MKKIILSAILFASVVSANATGTVITTTTTVAGSPKSVVISNPPGGGTVTNIECDPLGPACYTVTTTTTMENRTGKPQIGDKFEIDISNPEVGDYHIIGGFISNKGGVLPNGDVQHSYILSENWNE